MENHGQWSIRFYLGHLLLNMSLTWAPNHLNYTHFGAEYGRPSWLPRQVVSIRALGLLWDYMKVWEIQKAFDQRRPCWFTGEPNTSACTWQSITYSCLRERWEWNTHSPQHVSFTFWQFTTMALSGVLMPDLLLLSNHRAFCFIFNARN